MDKMTFHSSSSPSQRPKTLMELLLAKKIEAASAEGNSTARRLLRTDSLDSVSSIGSCSSLLLGEDVCRCDDCILGIVDLYITRPQEKATKHRKVKRAFFTKLNDLFGGSLELHFLYCSQKELLEFDIETEYFEAF